MEKAGKHHCFQSFHFDLIRTQIYLDLDQVAAGIDRLDYGLIQNHCKYRPKKHCRPVRDQIVSYEEALLIDIKIHHPSK